MSTEEIRLYDKKDSLIRKVNIPKTFPSTKIVCWQQKIFLKNDVTGRYTQEHSFIIPLIKKGNE